MKQFLNFHLSNMDQLRERALTDPYVRRAFDLVEHAGASWEMAITAVALALSEDRERLVKECVRLLENQPGPYMFPADLKASSTRKDKA